MISLELISCAQKVLQDQETGAVSLINLVQELHPATIPTIIPSLKLVTIFRREEPDSPTPNIKLEITNDNGYKQEIPLDVNFGTKSGTRLTTSLQGLAVLASGKITFEVFEAAEPRRNMGKWVIWIYAPAESPLKVEKVQEPTGTA